MRRFTVLPLVFREGVKHVDELESEDLPVNNTMDSTRDRGVLNYIIMFNYDLLSFFGLGGFFNIGISQSEMTKKR